VTDSPKPQFLRFLNAAKNDRRVHLEDVFTSKFEEMARASREHHQGPATASSDRAKSASGRQAGAEDCGRELTFACSACGSTSINLPTVLKDASEVRCGSCSQLLMKWKEFKLLCQQHA
jgi:hypothetical protein